jgi:hypothetical protein
MLVDELRAWIVTVDTWTLELTLLQGDTGKPKWFIAEVTYELRRRRTLTSRL